MKIQLHNLGIMRYANFSLADFTIICGMNNTGKTYATYALFGFLYLWQRLFKIDVPGQYVESLLYNGSASVDLSHYFAKINTYIADACRAYSHNLATIFAAPENRFRNSSFALDVTDSPIDYSSFYQKMNDSQKNQLFSVVKEKDSNIVNFSLLVDTDNVRIDPSVVKSFIGKTLTNILLGPILPYPFIVSAERTGAAIFRKELNFARNRLLEEIGSSDKDIDPSTLLSKVYSDYALPVKINVDFIRQLESVAKQESWLSRNHPEIMTDFADLLGGRYQVTQHDELYFLPGKSRTRLSMIESSSGARSLLDLGFYLAHVANRGDLLIVDEPELNLHPENQRRMARLFARLVNSGIKVFITTHSDYIIKELNTLIMLRQDRPHLQALAEREGYLPEELLSYNRLAVYEAGNASCRIPGGARKQNINTLTRANVTPKAGIELLSFDRTIETMNRIQEEILWGDTCA